jgi:hypothetical protein
MRSTDVTNELSRIQTDNGGLLRAADVVREASHPGSPLHDYFNWADDEAAHQWRLQQARQLIRVTVTYLPYVMPQYQVRAYVSLGPDRQQPGGGYKALVEVLKSPSERQQLLADALAELNKLKVRYHHLTELAGVFAAINRAQQSHGQPPPPDSFNGDPPSAPM